MVLLNLAGCTAGPSLDPLTSPSLGARADAVRVLRPLPNAELEIETAGTIGPRAANSALDRGFGEYDSHLQSSLYLCAGTGPAAGPCLAVFGGLFALAGVASSLAYAAVEGEQGRAATAMTHASFANLPAIASLSTRIAATAAVRAASAGRSLIVRPEDCIATIADRADLPASTFELDVVHMKLDFTPGYQFRLTLVARVTERACAAPGPARRQRLAYLGPTVTMSKDPSRAAQAFNQALDAAVIALGPEVDLYLAGKRPSIEP